MSSECKNRSGLPIGGQLNQVLKWYTVDEVAEKLRIHKKTVYRMCQEGQLRHRKCGKSIRIPDVALEQF